jgi:hypothetical protein
MDARSHTEVEPRTAEVSVPAHLCDTMAIHKLSEELREHQPHSLSDMHTDLVFIDGHRPRAHCEIDLRSFVGSHFDPTMCWHVRVPSHHPHSDRAANILDAAYDTNYLMGTFEVSMGVSQSRCPERKSCSTNTNHTAAAQYKQYKCLSGCN